MKRTFILSLTLLSTLCAPAQTMLTLKQILAEAVQNNQELLRANNDVLASTEQRKEAYTKYFPTLSATGMGMAATDNLIEMNMMGMNLGLVKNGVMGTVMAMQPVYAGGQIVNGNKLARVGEEASRLQRHLTENEVLLTAETYFWQTVMLKEKLRTLDRVEEQIRNARKDAQAAVEAGVRNRNDLLQVQLRQNEIRSTRIQMDNSLNVVRDLLAQCIGRTGESIDADFTMPDSAAIASPQAVYAAPETALPTTNEYQLLGKQVEAEQLNYKLARGKNLPTLAIGGTYYYHNLMDRSANNLVGMVSLSVPISGWWGGSHEMKRKKLAVANAQSELHDKSEQLIIRMRKAWNDLTDTYKQVGIARESVQQSEENLRLNADYYQAGTVAVSELLDAQTLYQQSRDKYVEAYTQYAVKTREYLQATGR